MLPLPLLHASSLGLSGCPTHFEKGGKVFWGVLSTFWLQFVPLLECPINIQNLYKPHPYYTYSNPKDVVKNGT